MIQLPSQAPSPSALTTSMNRLFNIGHSVVDTKYHFLNTGNYLTYAANKGLERSLEICSCIQRIVKAIFTYCANVWPIFYPVAGALVIKKGLSLYLPDSTVTHVSVGMGCAAFGLITCYHGLKKRRLIDSYEYQSKDQSEPQKFYKDSSLENKQAYIQKKKFINFLFKTGIIITSVGLLLISQEGLKLRSSYTINQKAIVPSQSLDYSSLKHQLIDKIKSCPSTYELWNKIKQHSIKIEFTNQSHRYDMENNLIELQLKSPHDNYEYIKKLTYFFARRAREPGFNEIIVQALKGEISADKYIKESALSHFYAYFDQGEAVIPCIEELGWPSSVLEVEEYRSMIEKIFSEAMNSFFQPTSTEKMMSKETIKEAEEAIKTREAELYIKRFRKEHESNILHFWKRRYSKFYCPTHPYEEECV